MSPAHGDLRRRDGRREASTGVRLLHQLRRPLPVTDVDRRGAAPLAVRPFRPGVDDEAWLR